MGRLGRSEKQKDTHAHVLRLHKRYREALAKGKPPDLDERGLQYAPKSEHDSPAYVYWAERGGTPYGLAPKLSPILETPEMGLWIRIDQEFAGGESYYPAPADLETVFRWYAEAIYLWVDALLSRVVRRAKIPEVKSARPTREDCFATMRYLCRQIASARAEVAREDDK